MGRELMLLPEHRKNNRSTRRYYLLTTATAIEDVVGNSYFGKVEVELEQGKLILRFSP